ncbi:unnamed protein product [Nippostrongylus brasiliensis]|uniref:Acyl_transf_3 domain-containing protein n=1 Tax=Nippostrongylus brasiliensis TaxID=27835 RepID=A0A0N4XZN5_NIPBR|nr:unnamed protein product [Nippostrongylus brasiliensis]
MRRRDHRLDLQGLRGVAILSVLGFHFFPSWFPNGYVGVDQFFVLSGFLMAMILNSRSGSSNIFDFYYGRLKRIVPMYILIVFLTLWSCIFFFPASNLDLNMEAALPALTFLSNLWHTDEESEYFIEMRRRVHRLDLQGLRGVAILSVLGFHFFPSWFPNGYVGVDQFFVLSGFLMAMILDSRSGSTNIFDFYYRRLKRIVPMYILIVFLTLWSCILFFPASNLDLNMEAALPALTFVSNLWHTDEESEYFIEVGRLLVQKSNGLTSAFEDSV